MSLFCDVENEEEKEGVEVFMKDDDDFWLKKGCEDLGREVAEEEGVVIEGTPVIVVGAAVVIVRGAVE